MCDKFGSSAWQTAGAMANAATADTSFIAMADGLIELRIESPSFKMLDRRNIATPRRKVVAVQNNATATCT